MGRSQESVARIQEPGGAYRRVGMGHLRQTQNVPISHVSRIGPVWLAPYPRRVRIGPGLLLAPGFWLLTPLTSRRSSERIRQERLPEFSYTLS
jgi:hypothetical protein